MKTLLKIAHHYKTILLADEFILTGSTALKLMGFDVSVKDLDIILVKPNAWTLEVLQHLENANPPKNLLNYPQNPAGKKIFRFIHDGTMVDVFIHDQNSDSNITTNCGLKIASLSHIIDAKLRMGRPKDWIQLLNLGRGIMSDVRFNEYIYSHANHVSY
jgi:hypothetical protein